MNIDDLIADKTIKPKQKTETISGWILAQTLPLDELIAFAEKQKDSAKATCIEAIEYATKQNPKLADESVLAFVSETITEKAPRIKWESAKVIGNIAHLFPTMLEKAVSNLLIETKHSGTVVRWSAAFALSEILKLNTKLNINLLPTLDKICQQEEKNSIKKIYAAALKKQKLNV